jgi:hypothetical protein
MLPYKVYKKCQILNEYLFKIVQACRTAKKIPLTWRISSGVFIPKIGADDGSIFKVGGTETAERIEELRPIALMNVEGKLFWAMVAQRFYDYLITDSMYIDITKQKGSIHSMSGCLEHNTMSWTALKDARKQKKSLVLIWLDLANAYGSVPHQLIFFALKRYGVPKEWIELVRKYYDGLWGRLKLNEIISDWELFEKGIFAGCTLSVILFLAAINVVLEYVSIGKLPRYRITDGPPLPLIRGFMDDLALAARTVPVAKMILKRVTEVLRWARMKQKAKKSRSLVMVKGRTMNVKPFEVEDVAIPSVQEKPIKSLGRVYNHSVSDKKAREQLQVKVKEGILKIDKSDFTGYMKLWFLNHVLVPKFTSQLTVYEVPMSKVENMERMMNKYTRKWMGVSKILSETALYGKQVPCPLPIRSFRSVFKTFKTSALLRLKYSNDEAVTSNSMSLDTGRKWKVRDAVERAESRIRLRKITESGQLTRAGLGLVPREPDPAEGSKEYRELVVSMVKKEEEERLYIAAIQQGIQGAWTRWKDFIQRDLRWKNILAGPPALTSFCIGATYGTLASPANLKRWGLSNDSKCELCENENAGIQHILSGCNIALGQGRYRFRHNEVLRSLAQCLQKQLVSCKGNGKRKRVIHFVKEGEQPKTSKKKPTGILQDGTSWKMLVDLDRQLVFPLIETLLRPDMVLLADKEKIAVIIELTCPVVENIEARHSEKSKKYEDLAQQCRAIGWKTHLFAVEVGARGYAAQSLWTCWKKLGIPAKEIKAAVKGVSDVALRCSFWVWMARRSIFWTEKEVVSRESEQTHEMSSQQTNVLSNQQTNKQPSRQINRQPSQQTDMQSSQQSNKQSSQQTNMQTSQKTNMQTSQNTNMQTSQKTNMQSSQKTNMQSSQQTNMQSSQPSNMQASHQQSNNQLSQQRNNQHNQREKKRIDLQKIKLDRETKNKLSSHQSDHQTSQLASQQQTNKQPSQQKKLLDQQTNKLSNQQTNELCSQQINKLPHHQANQQPDQRTNKQSSKQTNKQPSEQANKKPGQQTNKQPGQQTNKQSGQQTNKQPSQKTNKQSSQQSNNQSNQPEIKNQSHQQTNKQSSQQKKLLDQQTSKLSNQQSDDLSSKQINQQPDKQTKKQPEEKKQPIQQTNNHCKQQANKQSSHQTKKLPTSHPTNNNNNNNNKQSNQQTNKQPNTQKGNGKQQVREQHSPVPVTPKQVLKQVRPGGLKNFGNTCFLNAVIQCLKVADNRDWEAVARKVKGTTLRTATVWEEYMRTIDDMKRGRRSYLSLRTTECHRKTPSLI